MASSNEIVQIEQIDKALTALNIKLNATSDGYLKIVKNISDGSAVINAATASTENLAKAQKATATAQSELEKQNKVLADSEKKLQTFDAALYEQLQKNTKALADQKKAINDKLKASDAEEGSLVRMRQKLSELTTAYDKSGTRTKEAAAEINKLSREIGIAEAATNRHQRGVGGYADQLGSLKGVISSLPGPLGGAINAAEGLVTKFAAFGPVGLWVGGTLLSIGAPLLAFFTKSEEGVEMLERKIAGVKAAVSVLVGELIKSGSKMAESFDDTGKKGQVFWTFLMTSLNPAWAGIGGKMDAAAIAAEKYTAKLQDMEKEEIKLIVPRAEANNKIKESMLLYNDQSKSMDTRLNGLRAAIDLENKTADVEIKAQHDRVENLKIINEEKEKAGQLRNDDVKKLQEAVAKEIDLQTESYGRQTKSTKRILAGQKEMLAESEKDAKESLAKRLENLEIANDAELQTIKQNHILGKTDDARYNSELELQQIEFLKRKLKLYKAGSKDYEDIEMAIQDAEIKRIADKNKTELTLMTASSGYKKTIYKSEEQTIKDNAAQSIKITDEKVKKETEIEKKAAEQQLRDKRKLLDLQKQFGMEVINGIFNLQTEKRSAEIDALEKEKDVKLSNTKLTADQKAKIEADYAKKEAAIKTKQAKADKLQSAFKIALSTGEGAAKAVAESPITGGMPFLAWVLAIGAAQLAFVLAQPIPKFAKGTKNAPERGIFGEAGLEAMFTKDNDILMANKATYFEGSKFKGAQILSNPETEKLIRMGDRSGGRQMASDDRLLNEMRLTRKAIESKPVAIYDKDHRAIGQGNSRYQEIYLNRLLRRN